MVNQEQMFESDTSLESVAPSQAEVDAKFNEIVAELTPTPESDHVKDIVAYKSVQRGEPKEHNYKMW